MGGHDAYVLGFIIGPVALPLWLLVRIGARMVNAIEAAVTPLHDIALLHYGILGVPAPSTTAAMIAEAQDDLSHSRNEQLQGLFAEKGSPFNPYGEGEEPEE